MTKYEVAKESPNGERFCSNCGLTKNSYGGYWKTFDNGSKRRWLCGSCAQKRKLNQK